MDNNASGHRRCVLYTYDTSSLSKTGVVKFYYALKGRDGRSGIIKKINCLFLAKKVLLVNEEHDEELKEFLLHWNLPFVRRKLTLEEEEAYNEV